MVSRLRRHTIPTGLKCGIVLASILLLWSSSLVAQSSNSERTETEQLIQSYQPTSEEFDSGPLPEPQISEASLERTWRRWRDDLDEESPNVAILETLRDQATRIGIRNASRYLLASLAELRRIEGASWSEERRRHVLDGLGRLTPDLPFAHLARARIVWTHTPTRVSDLVGDYALGLQSAFQWPNTRIAWTLELLSVGLASLVLALVFFAFGQCLRHLGVVAHDLQRLLPDAVSGSQGLVGLLLMAAIPALVYRSPLLGATLLLGMASLPQHLGERALAVLTFGSLALLPTIDSWLDDALHFQGSSSQQLLEAQYLSCGDSCLERLERERSETADSNGASPDETLLYTWALTRIRTGRPAAIERALHRLQEADFQAPIRGHALNLIGAAMIARGRPRAAIEPLERASDILPNAPSPVFNLMRAHQKRGDIEASRRAFRRAVERAPLDVSRAKQRSGRTPASFLMLSPLPQNHFWSRHRRRHTSPRAPSTRAWRYVAGPHIPFRYAPWWGGLGALVVMLTGLPWFMGRVSTPCPRCSMARAPSDSERTRDHPHCYPCFRTFFGGGDLAYETRRHYESLLDRRANIASLLRRSLSLIAPGMGHAYAGRPILGVLTTASAVSGLLFMLDLPLAWCPPRALLYRDWLGLSWLGWGLASLSASLVLWALVNDIEPHSLS